MGAPSHADTLSTRPFEAFPMDPTRRDPPLITSGYHWTLATLLSADVRFPLVPTPTPPQCVRAVASVDSLYCVTH